MICAFTVPMFAHEHASQFIRRSGRAASNDDDEAPSTCVRFLPGVPTVCPIICGESDASVFSASTHLNINHVPPSTCSPFLEGMFIGHVTIYDFILK